MEEVLAALFSHIVGVVLILLRILLFLTVDIGLRFVVWPIGWFFCRIISLGHFPFESISEFWSVSCWKAFWVELVGIAVLGAGIYFLSLI